ncbi:MAG: hypothetical protein IT461_08255 [Planctomycetes bacterium]|nr:hypothetical protein [Planctomycetota bacterium]
MPDSSALKRKNPAKTIKISGRAFNNLHYAINEIGGEPRYTIQQLVDICLDRVLQDVIAENKKPTTKLRFISADMDFEDEDGAPAGSGPQKKAKRSPRT